MSERTPTTFRADTDVEDHLDTYTDRHDLNRTEAINQLLRAGLREHKTPMLLGWQENAVQSSHYLMVAAIVTTVFGLTPQTGIGNTQGLLIGSLLVLCGLALLAVVELARTVSGQSRLGAVIRMGVTGSE